MQKMLYATTLSLVRGDITRANVDAIINDATPQLKAARGPCKAIFEAAGPAVLSECQKYVEHNGLVEPGQAVVTGGGLLRVKYIIHAVGPIWQGGGALEEQVLANTYNTALKTAADYGLTVVAITPLAINEHRYPVEKAAAVSINAVESFCGLDERLKQVQFIMSDQFVHSVYQKAMTY